MLTGNSSSHPAPAVHSRLLEESSRLPLLIAGVAGVPGYNGFFHFRSKYGQQVIGARPSNNWRLSEEGIHGVDFENPNEARTFIEKHQFKALWNCGGSCALKACELDPDMARRVNVASIKSMVDVVKDTGIRFVHFSIDLVYSGAGLGGYAESTPADPVSMYGKTMREAEEIILAEVPSACILRISLPMGISFNGHAGAIDWIQHRFAKDKPATLYFDEVRTPTYVECMNEMIEEVIAGDLNGLYHAGGQRRLSLYEIAQIVNRVGGYDPSLLQGCPRWDAGPTPPRAGNVNMNSQRLAEALGRKPFVPWPFDESMVPDDRLWHFRRDTSWAGSKSLLEERLYNRPSDASLDH